MKKILGTGGAGYIGRVEVELMVAGGLGPLALDNLAEGHRNAVPRGVPLVKADVTDRDAVRSGFSRFKIKSVVHLAALALVSESVEEPARYYPQGQRELECSVGVSIPRTIAASRAALEATLFERIDQP